MWCYHWKATWPIGAFLSTHTFTHLVIFPKIQTCDRNFTKTRYISRDSEYTLQQNGVVHYIKVIAQGLLFIRRCEPIFGSTSSQAVFVILLRLAIWYNCPRHLWQWKLFCSYIALKFSHFGQRLTIAVENLTKPQQMIEIPFPID